MVLAAALFALRARSFVWQQGRISILHATIAARRQGIKFCTIYF
jgi:hypothetical protein